MELSAAEAKLLGLLEEGAKRPVGRHTRYRFVGATQEGDALVVFRASPKRAMEALTLAAMVESMPLEAAVRCCALIACSNNNLLLHALPAELVPASDAQFYRYVAHMSTACPMALACDNRGSCEHVYCACTFQALALAASTSSRATAASIVPCA